MEVHGAKCRNTKNVFSHFKGFNSRENIPFFHPTEENKEGQESGPSLALSVVEELRNSSNKLSFKVRWVTR